MAHRAFGLTIKPLSETVPMEEALAWRDAYSSEFQEGLVAYGAHVVVFGDFLSRRVCPRQCFH